MAIPPRAQRSEDGDDPPLPERGRDASRSRAAALLGWSALAVLLALTALAVRAAYSPPRLDHRLGVVGHKLAWWERNAEQTDLVFLGSSRVFRSIEPAVVDRTLEARGCAGHRSFNFGWAGISAPSLLKVVRVAALAPLEEGRTRWIVIDPSLAIGPPLYLPAHPRSRYANDWSTLPAGFEQLWSRRIPGGFADEAPWAATLRRLGVEPLRALRIDLSLQHVRAFSASVLGVGDARRVLFEPAPPPASDDGAVADRGFESLDARHAKARGTARERLDRRRLGPEDQERFAATLEEMREALQRPSDPWSPLERRLVQRFLAAARAPHTRVVVLLTPTVDPAGLELARRQELGLQSEPSPPVIGFDPFRNPSLFEMDRWFDRGHMSERGSSAYSQLVAEEICRLVHSAAGDA